MKMRNINASDYQSVTYKQINDMKHTIGFDKRKIKGTKHRTYEPYRNYFYAGEKDKADLDKLVEIGFMEKSSVDYYHVTDDGKNFLELVTGVKILSDMN